VEVEGRRIPQQHSSVVSFFLMMIGYSCQHYE
jgi:hypothetical protein